MSGQADLDDPARRLAAEHALGLTEGRARAEAERRAERDPAFRRAVEGWHADLEPLLEEVEPVAPPARARRALLAAIEEPARPAPRVRIEPWRALALLGMGSALGAGLVAAVLGGPPAGPAPAPGGGPILVATLAPTGAEPAALARLDRAAGALVVQVALAAEAERVPELWLIPGDGTPRSLGVLGGTGEASVPLDRLEGLAPLPGDTLALTLEPPGGSPTGGPTGPVVASGPLVEL